MQVLKRSKPATAERANESRDSDLACEQIDQHLTPAALRHRALLAEHALVYEYGLHPYVAHRAFLLIDKYVATIKDIDFGPAEGELGHDPDVGFGRAVNYSLPKIKTFEIGKAMHFWPIGAP